MEEIGKKKKKSNSHQGFFSGTTKEKSKVKLKALTFQQTPSRHYAFETREAERLVFLFLPFVRRVILFPSLATLDHEENFPPSTFLERYTGSRVAHSLVFPKKNACSRKATIVCFFKVISMQRLLLANL